MIPIKTLRENPERVKEKIATKGADPVLVDRFVKLDNSWRELTQEVDELRHKQNELSRERNIEKARENKKQLKEKEEKLRELDEERQNVWWQIPNLPDNDVPVGEDESENVVLRSWEKPPEFDFQPKDHLELGEALGIIDTQKAAEVAGARFFYLKGDAALLELALINHVVKILTDETVLRKIADTVEKDYPATPFIPVFPPDMIRPKVYRKMARLTDENKDDKFYMEKDDLYLIGSAEHTLGPIHMEETLNEGDLPIRYLGFSTAFRREAGSHGKDTRGILRVHQFDKLEMESFTVKENGRKEHDFLVAIQEHLMQSLELPYQVVDICTGDMGDPDIHQIDIEAWIPSQEKYRETHTADYVGDYQARRLNTRVHRRDNEMEFAHMNDATASSTNRPIIAILENNQQEDGSVVIPKVLRPYMGKDKIDVPK